MLATIALLRQRVLIHGGMSFTESALELSVLHSRNTATVPGPPVSTQKKRVVGELGVS